MAQATLQRFIDAKETLATLTYAIRSLDVCGSVYGTGPHAGQILRGQQAALKILGRVGHPSQIDGFLLRTAKKRAAEKVKAATEAKKAFGGIRQFRLAIAEPETERMAA